MNQISTEDRQRFYRVGALGLRWLQDRNFGARRFGEDQDARWRSFRGELTDADRLDLLLRDGAAVYARAFAARDVFMLPGLANDEPFGPTWASLRPTEAGPLIREASDAPATPEGAQAIVDQLRAAADTWGLAVKPPPADAVASLGPASRIVAAGTGAIIALAKHFAGRADSDLGDQTLLVTDHPGERQLFGLAVALSGSRAFARCLLSSTSADAATNAGFATATASVVSPDATSEARAAATALSSELGG